MNEEMITISKKRYDELVDQEEMLEALQAGGVDNWEWYGESLSEYWSKRNED